jgi:hypothetical protein
MLLDSVKQKLRSMIENVDYFIYSNPKTLNTFSITLLAVGLSLLSFKVMQQQDTINQLQKRVNTLELSRD